ncbi:MAG: Nucleoid-associated protein [Phycisphaerae bacterium]|nr:Nucleoid-associated protein [Phycisphaerae bacterium]
MFGSLGNLAQLIKQAGQLRENMARMQEELAKRTFEADTGAGLVRVTVNGRSELLSLKISPQAVGDVELLEDLIKGAINLANQRAQECLKSEMSKLTGGVSIPGLENILNEAR